MPAIYKLNPREEKQPWMRRNGGAILGSLALFVLLAAAWAFSFAWVVNNVTKTHKPGEDMATLLFGASSLALILYSLLLTILGLIGWNAIMKSLRSEVHSRVAKEVKAIRQELSMRHYSGMGFILGQLSYDAQTFETTDENRLEAAVAACQEAMKSVSGGEEEKPYRLSLLNNLVYYLTLRGHDVDAQFVLDRAKELEDEGWKSQDNVLILTACAAILRYSEDQKQRRQAKFQLLDISENPRRGVSEHERREARIYLNRFLREG